MKKTKVLLYFTLLLLLFFSVFAAQSENPDDYEHYESFKNGSINDYTGFGTYDLINTAGSMDSNYSFNATCATSQCAGFEKQFTTPNEDFCTQIETKGLDENDMIEVWSTDSGETWRASHIYMTATGFANAWDGVLVDNINASEWYTHTMCYNKTDDDFDYYLAEGQETSANDLSASSRTLIVATFDQILYNSHQRWWTQSGTVHWDGFKLWLGGFDARPTAGGAASPTIALSTNLTNNTNNYADDTIGFVYNATVSDGNDIVNVSFYQNGEFNITLEDINISDENLFNVTFPSTLEGYYNFTFNVSNEDFDDAIGVYIYRVDLVDPVISVNFTNNTRHSIYGGFLNFSSNHSDSNLYAYNITRTNQDNGSIMQNYFAENVGVTLTKNSSVINETVLGNFSYRVEVWDSHTAKTLKEIPVKNDKKITYRGALFYCNDVENITFDLLNDRVSPVITFKTKKKYQTCYYELENPVKVKNSKYKNHYVDLGLGVWVDEDTDGHISLIESNKVKFVFNTEEKKVFKTNSIGDLNYVTKTWSYEVYQPVFQPVYIEPSGAVYGEGTSSPIELPEPVDWSVLDKYIPSKVKDFFKARLMLPVQARRFSWEILPKLNKLFVVVGETLVGVYLWVLVSILLFFVWKYDII